MEPSPPPTITQPEETPAPPSSLAARLLNVFAAPGEVFDEIASRPVATANWLAPALLLIVVSWLAVWWIFSQPAILYQLSDLADQAMKGQPNSAHVGEQMVLMISIISALVGSLLLAVMIPFFWGLILWLVGDKVLKGGFSYMKAVEVAGLANMIAVLDAIVKTLLAVVTSNVYASVSAAMLVKNFDLHNPVHALLVYVNVMTFWLLGVRACGLARLARISFARAAAWVFGIWIVYNGVFFGLSQALQVLGKRMAPH